LFDYKEIREKVNTERSSARSENQSLSVLTSMASSFKNFKNKFTAIAHELIGTPSNSYRPAVEELFKETEFISDWILESSGSPPSGLNNNLKAD